MACACACMRSTTSPSELARAVRSPASAPLSARTSSRSRMMRRATSRTAAVSTWGRMAVCLASAAGAWRTAELGGGGLAGPEPQSLLVLRPRGRYGGRELAGERAGDGLLRELVVPREPDLAARGGGGNRVQPRDEGVRLGAPDAGRGLAGTWDARAVGRWCPGVLEEEPVQVHRHGPAADPGSGGGGEGAAHVARRLAAGDQPPVLA